MPVRGEHRIKKLESSLLTDLSPDERVRMVLTARAEGDKDQARRIGQACPWKVYDMIDADYLERLDLGHRLCLTGLSQFREDVVAHRTIEGVKDVLCSELIGVVASHASTLSIGAMLHGQDDDAIDWPKVDAAEKEGREYGSGFIARMLAVIERDYRRHVRAEWTAFDTMCREETGLDAWTIFKGYGVPGEFIAELQGLLSADADEPNGGEPDEAAVAERLAVWRKAAHAATGKADDAG